MQSVCKQISEGIYRSLKRLDGLRELDVRSSIITALGLDGLIHLSAVAGTGPFV